MAAHWRAEGLKPDFAMGIPSVNLPLPLSADTIRLNSHATGLSARRANAAVRKRRDVAVFADEDTLMPLARQFELDSPPTTVRNIRYFPGRKPVSRILRHALAA